MLLLSIPSVVGFIVLKEPIIRTIFKFTNKFNESAVSLAGNILMLFAFALISQSLVTILIRAFYANNNTKTPLYIGSSTILTTIFLSYIFYKYTNLGVSGLALAYSISSVLNATFLLIILNKKMNGIYLNKLLEFSLKITPCININGYISIFIKYVHAYKYSLENSSIYDIEF